MAIIDIPSSGVWGTIATALNTMFSELFGRTGWGQYQDTQYTSVSPFALAADTDTNLPNNAGSVIETQKPTDVTTFYDGTVITGRNGDGVTLTIEFQAEPTNVATTYLEVWVDIGGSVGELYRRIITFPKGQGWSARSTLRLLVTP